MCSCNSDGKGRCNCPPTVDWSMPIRFNDGDDLEFVGSTSDGFKVVYSRESGFVYRVNSDGLFNSKHGSSKVVNKKSKRQVWLNLYRDAAPSNIYHSRYDADNGAGFNRVECRLIEWEV